MIHIVVARPEEAEPLVRRYDLIRQEGSPFPLYVRDTLALVISGPGKKAAAAATGWLQPVAGGRPGGAWLSLGVAGHSEMEIGRGLLVHKVVDEASGECWYPAMVLEHPASSATVHTVEQLDGDYAGGVVYDTEAAGFFATASRFATAELVQAYRVVVDNHSATLGESFTPEVVQDLVASKLRLLDGFIDELREMAALEERRLLDGGLREARWGFAGGNGHDSGGLPVPGTASNGSSGEGGGSRGAGGEAG